MLKMLLFLFPLLRLALWAAGGASPTGGAQATGAAGDGAADDTPPAGDPQPGDSDPPTGGDKTPGETMFTQADIDRFTGKARREALARWAKDHGFADVKDLEVVIQAKKDADDKAKDDLTKANERAQRESERAEAAEKRLYEIVLKFGFQLAAVDQVSDLEVAYLTAQHLGLLSGEGPVEIDLDLVSVKGMDKVIEKLLKEKPLLKKAQAALPAGTGGASGGNTVPGQMTKEQEAAYRQRYGIR